MTIARICGRCQTLLNPTNTGGLGHLQPDCNDCTQKHLMSLEVKYRKLLEFVKLIALNNSHYIADYPDASDLLKEIGESE